MSLIASAATAVPGTIVKIAKDVLNANVDTLNQRGVYSFFLGLSDIKVCPTLNSALSGVVMIWDNFTWILLWGQGLQKAVIRTFYVESHHLVD